MCILFLPEISLVAGQGEFKVKLQTTNYNHYECYLFLICLDNSLTFSPSTPLCVGYVVQMICYVIPPTAQQFDSSAAEISFNGSTTASLNQINNNLITGVDTSRYTADLSGLTISSSRPGIRLTIFPYQTSDGATNFSCHGVYAGGVPSESLISGYPQALAGLLCLCHYIFCIVACQNFHPLYYDFFDYIYGN